MERIRFHFTALAIANMINVFVTVILVVANIEWADKFFIFMSAVFTILIALLYVIDLHNEN